MRRTTRCKITDEAIEAAVKLSARYIADRYLPDKAIDLIDEAASARAAAQPIPPRPISRSWKRRSKSWQHEKAAAVNAQDFERAAANCATRRKN